MKKLKIRTLSKGWCDRDAVLLHAAFQILVDFVEKEKPDKYIDWDADKRHRKAWREITKLHTWWTKKRPARKSPLDDKKLKPPSLKFKKIRGSKNRRLVQPDRKKYAKYYKALDQHRQLTEKWEAEDQRNLHRLIDVRGFLWT